MRVLGISGSLRRDSHNTALLRAAGELIEEQGAEFEVFDALKAIPPYDEDDDVGNGPIAVARLRRAIAGADAVLAATGARVTEVELAVGHAHEHLDAAGHLTDPTQQEALSDSVRVLLGQLEN